MSIAGVVVYHVVSIYLSAITLFTNHMWYKDGTYVDIAYANHIQKCITLVLALNGSCSDIDVYQYRHVENEGMYRRFLCTPCSLCHNKVYLCMRQVTARQWTLNEAS